jgi:LacI family transcriptional regulator
MSSERSGAVRRVTLHDVAREAGVSLATASRAINGSSNRSVNPELRAVVLAAAQQLHYVPDQTAQAMARGRSATLGLVLHEVADPYFSSIAAGVTEAAEEAGLAVTLANTHHDPDRELRLVTAMLNLRPQAIILVGGRRVDAGAAEPLERALTDFREQGGQVAVVSQPVLPVSTVDIDNAGGAADLAGALCSLGFRRFAVLSGPAAHLTARDRTEGFRAGLAAGGGTLPEGALLHCAFTRDGGYAGMAALLRDGPEVDLVFAVNDVMAVGAMAAARHAGLRLPEDIAIAGFDDIVTLRDTTPALTTVRLPLLEIGRRVTELALASGPGREPAVARIAGEVVLRESTPGPGARQGRVDLTTHP